MSEPTSPTTPNQGGAEAPRRSRRAIREAEREAEREALLTGQQPLLTRRELRRLREEAQALQAAIEAGEITLEQAKALQNPLAEAPNIDIPPLSATGTHAAVQAQPASSSEAEPPTSADVTPTPTHAAAQSPTPLSQREKEEIAQAATGVLSPEDMAAAAPASAKPEPTQPPSVPDRRSVFGRQEPAIRPATLSPATPKAADPVPTPQAAAPAPAAHKHAAAAASEIKETSPAASTTPAKSDETAPTSQEAAKPTTPTRKPIVRIPAAAQGVRTIDSETGELSAVKVIDDSFTGIETPQWKALRDGDVTAAPGVAKAHTPASAWAPLSSSSASPAEAAGTSPLATPDKAPSWQQVGVSVPQAGQDSPSPVDEPAPKGHKLLMALVVVVVLLVIATILWFYFGRNTASAATLGAMLPGGDGWLPPLLS